MKNLSLVFKKTKMVLAALFGIFFFSANNVLAAPSGTPAIPDELTQTATEGGLPTLDLFTTIGTLVNALLGLLGVIFLLLTIYAGFLWMTARGETDQVKKAKNILMQAVIGIIIVTSAYAITAFIGTDVLGLSQ